MNKEKIFAVDLERKKYVQPKLETDDIPQTPLFYMTPDSVGPPTFGDFRPPPDGYGEE